MTAGGAGDSAAGPVRRSRPATRERLLEAAREVFGERGIGGATVEEICERAGFTRGAFYSNFTRKEELVRILLEREEEQLLGQLGEIVEAGLRSPDPLRDITEQLLAAVPQDRSTFLVRSELAVHAVRDPSVAREHVERQERFRHAFGPVLESALTALGRRLTVSTQDATDVLQAVFETSVRQSLTAAPGGTELELAARMLPRLLDALSEEVPRS